MIALRMSCACCLGVGFIIGDSVCFMLRDMLTEFGFGISSEALLKRFFPKLSEHTLYRFEGISATKRCEYDVHQTILHQSVSRLKDLNTITINNARKDPNNSHPLIQCCAGPYIVGFYNPPTSPRATWAGNRFRFWYIHGTPSKHSKQDTQSTPRCYPQWFRTMVPEVPPPTSHRSYLLRNELRGPEDLLSIEAMREGIGWSICPSPKWGYDRRNR